MVVQWNIKIPLLFLQGYTMQYYKLLFYVPLGDNN